MVQRSCSRFSDINVGPVPQRACRNGYVDGGGRCGVGGGGGGKGDERLGKWNEELRISVHKFKHRMRQESNH